MKKLILLVVAGASLNAAATEKVAYGEDNRIDVVDSRNNFRKNLAKSTATQIPNKNLTLSEDGQKYALANTTLADFMPRLSWGTPLCEGEKFGKQLAIGNCSGFLVGDKYLVTAGHCMTSQDDCDGSKWAFDYKKGEVEDLEMEASKIYSCKTIIKQDLNGSTQMDYALIELDRAVTDREPLKYRKEGEIKVGEGVVVIGSPSGLPLKIAGDSTVQSNDTESHFSADLDTFGGNSGSAVFNATSGEVEGILVRGAKDYATVTRTKEDGSSYRCMTVNFCEDGVSGYSCGGEDVTKITNVGIEEAIQSFEAQATATETEAPAVVLTDVPGAEDIVNP
ncbi:serine protease [Halobacteriovorax sp. HLS]|uniref:trypsin-like serine peptidase n=1 Tax=Halobacteriovorax sp. HLS TaxID=2234000 RepID=UPI000FD96283|nr:serine protease [Halobacteriovorax sp. HLS]